MKHSTNQPTKAEQARFDELQRIGCVVCRIFRKVPEVPAEVHHLVEGNKRLGHLETIPLCAWHHRGVIPLGYSSISAREKFGPSKARSPDGFVIAYGWDRELLAATNQLIDAMAKGRAA